MPESVSLDTGERTTHCNSF
jgi:hypothetical protein